MEGDEDGKKWRKKERKPRKTQKGGKTEEIQSKLEHVT
jgi:hypothetical protein